MALSQSKTFSCVELLIGLRTNLMDSPVGVDHALSCLRRRELARCSNEGFVDLAANEFKKHL